MSKKKILHICTDEKFIDFTITKFNGNITVKSEFVVVVSNTNNELKHIEQNKEVTVCSYGDIKEEFFQKFENYKYVLFHSWNTGFVNMILKSDYKNFIWFPWGEDFYNQHPTLSNKMMLPKTSLLFSKIHIKSFINEKTKRFRSVLHLRKDFWQLQEEALKRVRYIAPVIDEDFDLIIKTYKNTEHINKLKYSYGDITSFAKLGYKVKGDNILLGNSASFNNNHIEAFEQLSKIKLEDRKVITILSYGDEKYGNYIEKYGKVKLPSNFMPIRSFMPKDNYIDLISTCEFVIMNQNRQQAMGNIYAMLYGGAKLFIRKENPTFKFLKNNLFYFTEMDDLNDESISTPLSDVEKVHNRQVVMEILSEDKTQEYVDILINKIINEH